ncbi:polymer-forming cytoskeletal protein [Curvibacter sp. APW13]|uniref:polymer-forming cytoskeletal protein n=1 Tax=Curvibacter sp. APW13 TaxID=3077236 RepID=UPI0028DE265E|nr:polymer-forming cytoskeletal protein [Curvibacter sp. APW13]MDT8992741.1 polymer-forming cytoskeletal protein [Curvibacter sp. APW13]
MNTSATAVHLHGDLAEDASNVHRLASLASRGNGMGAQTAEPTDKQKTAYSEIVIDPARERLSTYIAPGAVIKGSIEVGEGARVAGTVTGDLICANGSAVIEPGGEVMGSVHASERVIVMGGRVGTPASDPNARPSTELVCPGEVIVIGPGVAHVVAYYGTLNAYDGGYIDGGARPYSKRGQ